MEYFLHMLFEITSAFYCEHIHKRCVLSLSVCLIILQCFHSGTDSGFWQLPGVLKIQLLI